MSEKERNLIENTIKEVDGLTPNEKDLYTKSLINEIKRLRIKSILKDDEMPSEKQLNEWKVSMDKLMIQKLVKGFHKRIFNYRRKLFGHTTITNDAVLANELNYLMKEVIQITYSDYETFEKFWGRVKEDYE